MFKHLFDWLDVRTGYRSIVRDTLDEPIPGGARWRYATGAAITSAFFMQLFTGLLLMFTYSPSTTTAWGSVFYINDVMTAGWIVRGIHHFGSMTTIIMLVLHLVQVVFAAGYRAPREVNWWVGVALLVVTLGLGLTGYHLPWDQKGYWSTKVVTNIVSCTPFIGPYLQTLLVGGDEYGSQTLSRFFVIHAAILPGMLIVLLVVHLAFVRKLGPSSPGKANDTKFWPEKAFKNLVAAAIVVAIPVALTLWNRGAPLDAPADPSARNYPARPEWYFLSLYQMLKYFPGEREVVGTIFIPSGLLAVLILMPFFDRILPRKLAHFMACSFVFGVVGGVGFLTYQAAGADARDASFQNARRQANVEAKRSRELALAGIPPEGAGYLLSRDPLVHGRDVLERKCLGCHYYDGKGVISKDEHGKEVMSKQDAADLKGFGSRAWVRGLLEKPNSSTYFGKVPQCGGMERWKKSSKLTSADLDRVADFVALFAEVDPETSAVEWANDPKIAKHPGLEAFQKECGQCHVVGESGLISEGGVEDAPNLFGWGSNRWIARMIKKPGAPDMYGFLDPKEQMPSFAGQLTDDDVLTVVRYLRDDYPGAPRAERKEKAAESAEPKK